MTSDPDAFASLCCLSFARSVLPCLPRSFPITVAIFRFGPSHFAYVCLPTRLPRFLPVRSHACCVSRVKTYPAAAICCQMLFDVVSFANPGTAACRVFPLACKMPRFLPILQYCCYPRPLVHVGGCRQEHSKMRKSKPLTDATRVEPM